jgi:hypothetical protein
MNPPSAWYADVGRHGQGMLAGGWCLTVPAKAAAPFSLPHTRARRPFLSGGSAGLAILAASTALIGFGRRQAADGNLFPAALRAC